MDDTHILIITWSLAALVWAVTLAAARWLPDEPVAWSWPTWLRPRWWRHTGSRRKPPRWARFYGYA